MCIDNPAIGRRASWTLGASLVLSLVLAPAVHAQTPAGAAGTPHAGHNHTITEVLHEKPGVVSWTVLAPAKPALVNNKPVIRFSPAIQSLHNKKIRLQGFMMRLGPGDEQQHFLLSSIQPTCDYELPAGAEGLADVRTSTPIKYSEKPIVLEGRFVVSSANPMAGYYALVDAVPVQPQRR